MPSNNVNAFIRAVEAEALRLCTSEPECCRRLRAGELEDRAGTWDQYFSTWDIAAGMVRDLGNYTLYPILVMARKGTVKGPALASTFRDLVVPYTTYLVYNGFDELDRWSNEAADILETADDGVADQVLCAMIRYVNRLTAWTHHSFPWHVGDHYKYDDVPERVAHAKPAAGLSVVDGPRIRLSWKPTGISVLARLNTRGNPELCADILAGLPFTVLQDHAVVTGASIFAWSPIVSTARLREKELICNAPVGRLRFSQRTGQKIVVQYGPVTETILSPILGQVEADDIEKLAELGHAVSESTLRNKEPIFLTVERV